MDFREYARSSDDQLDLLTGALLIARDAYPALDIAEQRARLDELAQPLAKHGLSRMPPSLQARLLSDYLYVVRGFRGDRNDYYDPRNSFLNDVLDRRTGIPITLGVVYIEVARRLGVNALGVGFPGHFLVRLSEAPGDPGAGRNEPLLIDPFHRGRLLGEAALNDLLRRAKVRAPLSSEMLEPARTRHVVARMLMNLRGIYTSRGDTARLLVVLDRLIDLLPDLTNELLERAQLYERLGAPSGALADYQRYLEVAPDGEGARQAQKGVQRLKSSGGRASN